MTGSNRQVITVSELNRDARRLLETNFPQLYVEGEISNFAQPGSGHWYFTLKDDKAQIRCAMFRNRNQRVRFKPKNGQQIIVRGSISLYEGRGEYQIIAEFLEDFGDGALRRAYDKLKSTLQHEGLFDEARKQPIPDVPNHIAIITSPTGAAIRDVIAVMQRRFPSIHLSILPVQVQGDESVPQIVNALGFANSFPGDPFDLILLTRGGGSLEDLWSFNTEPVARAIAASRLPVVCAVGHESDVTISDFVSDLRAPTPSAAAELITPDGAVWKDTFNTLARRLIQSTEQLLEDRGRELNHLTRRLRHPRSHLSDLNQRLDELERRLLLGIKTRLGRYRSTIDGQKLISPISLIHSRAMSLRHLRDNLVKSETNSRYAKVNALTSLASKLDTLSPLATLHRGYAIVSTVPDNHILTNSDEINPGDIIRARLNLGQFLAKVTEKSVTEKTNE